MDIRPLLSAMNRQREARKEQIRQAIAETPTPLPESLVSLVADLSPHDATEVLREHPGFTLWHRYRSYQASLSIFRQCMEDLLGAIDRLASLARTTRLVGWAARQDLDSVQAIIQKEIFSVGNAAHSLKDHASYRLQKVAQLPEYDSQIKTHFETDGLHDFVISLRRIMHHIEVIQPSFIFAQRAEGRDLETSVTLKKAGLQQTVSLLAASGSDVINDSGKNYLDNTSGEIDLRCVYVEYAKRASAFHTWLQSELDDRPSAELADIRRCFRANRIATSQTSWNLFLGNWLRNWKKPPNPYDHLHRFLSPDQLHQVMSLPRKSKEQVDLIISLIDKEGACNEEIRELVYELFDKAL